MHHGEAQRCLAWRLLTEQHLSPPATNGDMEIDPLE
jgi:hypothetical protein